MIFKKSKVLIDNILDPVSGKSHRGHQANQQIAETTLSLSDFFVPIPSLPHTHPSPNIFGDSFSGQPGRQQSKNFCLCLQALAGVPIIEFPDFSTNFSRLSRCLF